MPSCSLLGGLYWGCVDSSDHNRNHSPGAVCSLCLFPSSNCENPKEKKPNKQKTKQNNPVLSGFGEGLFWVSEDVLSASSSQSTEQIQQSSFFSILSFLIYLFFFLILNPDCSFPPALSCSSPLHLPILQISSSSTSLQKRAGLQGTSTKYGSSLTSRMNKATQ